MQTDLWLTESSNYDQCPLCGRLLKRGSQTCYACGFSVNSPSTAAVWIDPTVHAYQHVMPAQAGKQPNPTTPIPARASQQHTQQPLDSSPIWQYESPHYEAAGSLPMLSLIVSETPTQPQPHAPGKSTRRLPSIDEIDTVPPAQKVSGLDIDQVDAHPPLAGNAQRALMRVPQSAPAVQPIDSSSWTAGQARGSASAQLIARPAKRNFLPQALKVNPLDHTRWWLLRPGRIEFILWLGGTLLLIGVTCLLLLVSALSFQWSVPFASVGTNSAPAIRDGKSPVVPGSSIALVGPDTLVPGQSFQLRGRGFEPSSQVTFYFDGRLQLFNQHGRPASTRTNAQGGFDTTLWLGKGSRWTSGKHSLIARDTAAHVATLDVMLVDNNSFANASPVTSSTPGVTHTPTPATPVSTPVNKPPASVTPTPSPSPTRTTPTPTPSPSPTHTTTPTPTSTAGTTPTATPTRGTTPSPTPGAVTPTPTVSPTAATTGLGNSLNDSGAPPFAARLASVSPLVWLMVACYLLSMLFLGIAGVIHRRHR